MKKVSLIVMSSILFTVGCAKEKSVPDPGPNFSVGSMEVQIAKEGPNATAIHRDEPTSGPQIQIHISDGSVLTKVERKLLCGPVILQGRKVSSDDPTMMNFRLAEEEFPGLVKMPMVAKCKLSIIATNNIGSTTTKIVPVTLTFDKNPQLDITRLVSMPGMNAHNENFEIPLESYVIKNNFPYPITVRLAPKRRASIVTKVTLNPKGSGSTTGPEFYDLSEYNMKATRIEASGNMAEQMGDLVNEVRVVVLPEATVKLEAYGQIPMDKTSLRCAPPILNYPSQCSTFKGINVVSVSDPSPRQSLSILWGFEVAAEDFSNPNYFDFKEDHPLPRVSPAVVLPKTPLP